MEQAESGNTCLTNPALIVAVTDLDRWDISNTDGLKKKDMAAGVDEVITCPSRVQQLRDTLTTLGVPIDHLDYNKSPRAVFSSWNNTPVLAR
jgi:P2-related tail formation protein